MSAVSIVIRAKNEASSTFDRVKGDIKRFSEDGQKAMSGMKAANEAISKAMRGDLVGAAQSAATAFKSLWAVVISNPILIGIAAVTGAIALLVKAHHDAAVAAEEQRRAVVELNDEIARTKGWDPPSVKKEIAEKAVETGDRAFLEKMRSGYMAKAEDLEQRARTAGQLSAQDPGDKLMKERAESYMAAFKEAHNSLGIYEAAIAKLDGIERKKIEEKAKADQKAIDDKLEADRKAAAERVKFADDMNAELRRLDEQAAEARAAALQTIRREEFEEGVRLAEEEAKAKEQAAKDALRARKAAADEGAKAEEKAARESGRTMLGWHINAISQHSRSMTNSIGSLSQLRGSAFKSWNTKEGRDSIEVKGIDKTNTLLEDIGRKLA